MKSRRSPVGYDSSFTSSRPRCVKAPTGDRVMGFVGPIITTGEPATVFRSFSSMSQYKQRLKHCYSKGGIEIATESTCKLHKMFA